MNAEYNASVHLLCKVGLLALSCRQDEQAALIFGFSRAVLQDPVALDVSCAMIYSARGDVDEAITMLRDRALREFPDHDMAKAALGLVLQSSGRPGWQELYGQVLSTSIDPAARKAASQGMDAKRL